MRAIGLRDVARAVAGSSLYLQYAHRRYCTVWVNYAEGADGCTTATISREAEATAIATGPGQVAWQRAGDSVAIPGIDDCATERVVCVCVRVRERRVSAIDWHCAM